MTQPIISVLLSKSLQHTVHVLSISVFVYGVVSPARASDSETVLPTLEVKAHQRRLAPYAGGQVTTGGHVGLLGDQDTFDTPYSITGYTAKLIEDQQAKTLADVIVNDSSALLKSSAGGIGETISIRGFSMGGNDAELYDGVPGLGRRLFASTAMLERVEIFKGASALITGTVGAPGGTINLVPKRPLDRSLTQLTTSYEYKEALDTHLDISRRGGRNDQFGIRFNGSFQDGEGAIENSDRQLKEANLALQYEDDKLQIDAIFDYSAQDLDASPQQFKINGETHIPDAPDASKAIQQPWETMNDQFNRQYLKVQYQLADTWFAYGAYGETHYQGYWFRTTGAHLDDEGNFSQSLHEYYGEDQKSSVRTGVDGQFSVGSVSHHVAIDALRFTSRGGFVYSTVPGYNVSSNIDHPTFVSQPEFEHIAKYTPKTTKNIATSFAIADTIGFYDDLILLTLGARHQQIEAINYSPVTGQQTSRYKEAATTPSAGLLIKPSDDLSLYGNYIESLEQGPSAPTGSTNEGEVFEPTRTKQLEVGAKWDLGSLGLTTSLFQIKQPSGLMNADGHYSLDGEQRNRGIEVNAFGRLDPSLRLLGGVTYLDSALTKTQNGLNQGKDVVGVPKWMAVMGLEWDASGIEGLILMGRVNHVGSQYVVTDNSLKIPSYELYSVGARYTTSLGGQDITLRAHIDNLFNEKYWNTFVGVGNLLYTGASRQVNLSATIAF